MFQMFQSLYPHMGPYRLELGLDLGRNSYLLCISDLISDYAYLMPPFEVIKVLNVLLHVLYSALSLEVYKIRVLIVSNG